MNKDFSEINIIKSIHPYEPYIPKGAKKLIIGTIPPPRFCKENLKLDTNDIDFYYGSKDNSFWSLMQETFNKKFQDENKEHAIEQRKNLLIEISTGITDIISECIHINDSASDKDLECISHKKIENILSEYKEIETLIYTSNFVKKQINDRFKTYHIIDKDNRKKQTVKIDNKVYKVRILYSPSPNALRNMGEKGSEKRKLQYQEFLKNE